MFPLNFLLICSSDSFTMFLSFEDQFKCYVIFWEKKNVDSDSKIHEEQIISCIAKLLLGKLNLGLEFEFHYIINKLFPFIEKSPKKLFWIHTTTINFNGGRQINNCLIHCHRIGSLFRVLWGLFGAYWRSVGGFVGWSIRGFFGDYLGPVY